MANSSLYHVPTTPPLPIPHTSPSQPFGVPPQNITGIDHTPRHRLSPQTSVTSSITPSLSELLNAGSPSGSIPDDLYQLTTLWNGIKTALTHQRQRLVQIQDTWRKFDKKKEEFVSYLSVAEERVGRFFDELKKAKDFSVIQRDISEQKVRGGSEGVRERRRERERERRERERRREGGRREGREGEKGGREGRKEGEREGGRRKGGGRRGRMRDQLVKLCENRKTEKEKKIRYLKAKVMKSTKVQTLGTI